MNCRNCLFSVVFLLVSNIATAHVITEVRALNQTINSGETLIWDYDLAAYGFVAGRDTLGNAQLRVEIRDPDYRPDKEWQDQPFVVLFFGHREYMRVGIEDWVASSTFYDRDNITPAIAVTSTIPVWVGLATLTFEFTPGSTAYIPEPSPILLLTLGLCALALSRRHKIFMQQ
ncbi:MAG: hypothetical protein B0W54_14370 [Cellvibrio sp. 79]|nr:MAG: hypothetical protein B0W54_14370 [Cellvibrio sp. 79]